MDSSSESQFHRDHRYQNVVVMRHGDRIDNFDPQWVATAARPWDPPLTDAGRTRAFSTGRKLRHQLGFPIHRVFVSPFVRCVQTAVEVVSALCATVDDPISATGVSVPIDPSKLRVSIECGLCEMLNTEAIRSQSAPPDGNFGFNVSKLESLFPPGTVDYSVEPLYKEVPKWEETVLGARTRYVQVIETLSNKYPNENLLLVTHGEGVGVAVSAYLKDATVYEVEYCAYAELKRPILKDHKPTTANFDVLTHGIGLCPSHSSTYVFSQPAQ